MSVLNTTVEDNGNQVNQRPQKFSLLETGSADKIPSEESAKIKAIQALLLYTLFLGTFIFAIFLPEDTYAAHDMHRSVKATILDVEVDVRTYFDSVSSTSQLFTFISAVLLPALYNQAWYNGENLPANTATTYQPFFLNDVSMLLGTIRLRQIRVKNDTCVVASAFVEQVPNCYDTYSTDALDTSDFFWNGGETDFVSGHNLEDGGAWESPNTKTWYSSGGHVEDLPVTSLEMARAHVDKLKNASWIDAQSRVVFIDFSLYNPNVDQFCYCRLAVEQLVTGTFISTARIESGALQQTVRALVGDGSSTKLLMGFTFQIILYILVIAYMVRFADDVVDDWGSFLQYISVGWNVMDMIMVMCFLVNISLTVIWMLKASQINYIVNTSYEEDLWDFDTFFGLRVIMSLFRLSREFLSYGTLMCFLKSFKFIGLTPTLSSLTKTVTKAAKEMEPLVVILAVIITGYAVAFQMAFGYGIKDFMDFPNSVLALMLMILGSFNLQELRMVNPALGTVLFGTFMILVVFVVLPMLLKIVDVAFHSTMSEVHSGHSNQEFRRDMGLAVRSMVDDSIWMVKTQKTMIEATVVKPQFLKDTEYSTLVESLTSTKQQQMWRLGQVGRALYMALIPCMRLMQGKTTTGSNKVEDNQVQDREIIDRSHMLLHRQAIIRKLATKLEQAVEQAIPTRHADNGGPKSPMGTFSTRLL